MHISCVYFLVKAVEFTPVVARCFTSFEAGLAVFLEALSVGSTDYMVFHSSFTSPIPFDVAQYCSVRSAFGAVLPLV